jgi:hypothetical protein
MRRRGLAYILLALCVAAAAGCAGKTPRTGNTFLDLLQDVRSYSLIDLSDGREAGTAGHLYSTNGFPAETRRDHIVVGNSAFPKARVRPGKTNFPAEDFRYIFTHHVDRPPCDCIRREVLGLILFGSNRSLLGSITVDNHEGFRLEDVEGHSMERTSEREVWAKVMRSLTGK